MRRVVIVVCVLSLIVLAVPVTAREPAADQGDGGTIFRVAGTDRVDTAARASAAFFPTATDAVLATSANYPDALAAGGFAASLGAPLLLTPPDSLPAVVADELDRLGVQRVWIVGGPAAVGPAVQEALEADHAVERIAGDDRFATAVALAERVGLAGAGRGAVTLGAHGDPGRAWPDALSAGTYAALTPTRPLLLVTPDGVPDATTAAAGQLADGARLSLLGGPAAIPDSVAASLAAVGPGIDRIFGDTRYATSVAAVTDALAHLDATPRPLVVASGANYPDGLAGAAVAAQLDGVLLLLAPSSLADAGGAAAFLEQMRARVSHVVVMGGEAALSASVVDDLVAAMGLTMTDEPPPAAEPGADPADDSALDTRAMSTTSMLSLDGVATAIDVLDCDLDASTAPTPALADAVTALWAALEARESAEALAGFRASEAAKDVDAAAAAVAAAVAANRPGAALAATLTAMELEPSNPQHAVNAAGIALSLRPALPLEALALLDSAEGRALSDPMNVSGEGIALVNRGVALGHLRRFDEAAAAFQSAFDLDHDLRDALRMKGAVEICRDDEEEAVKLARAGMRPMVDREKHPPRTVGEPPYERTGVETIDVSQGTSMTFPPMFELPATPQQAYTRRTYFKGLYDEATAAHSALLAKRDALFDAALQEAQTVSQATKRRNTQLSLFASSLTHPGGELAHLAEAFLAPQTVVSDLNVGTARDCGDQPAHDQLMDALLEIHQLSVTMAEQHYPMATGVLAHMSLPKAHELAVTAKQLSYHVHWMFLTSTMKTWSESIVSCTVQDPPPGVPSDTPQGEMGQPCPPGLESNKVELDLMIASVAVNCTEVDVELATGDWMSAFVKGTYNTQTGDITVFVGVKAEGSLPGVKGAIREGFYVATNTAGEIKDVGFRVSAETNLGPQSASYSVDVASASFGVMSGFTTAGL